MKRLIVAFGFLTRVPMPQVTADAEDFASAIRWYPVVGACIGVVVAAAGWVGALVDPWTGALAALVIWVAITGALHLDGLADLADGLGAAHGNRDRLIAVMADPHIGSFGVVMIALQLIAKLVLLHAVSAQGWAVVIFVPMLARIGPLCWARWVPLLRKGGLGGMVAGKIRVQDLVFWGA
ncbi:adenosylcobinamide-GDP ribazoletransferase [Sphingomonas aerolata]|uniref:adenosylcobinamide-GDP ribazoletransferase n=1 Tax=Sphingomonas aerolata TaxID=185951 RepID=UPI002FE0ECE3